MIKSLLVMGACVVLAQASRYSYSNSNSNYATNQGASNYHRSTCRGYACNSYAPQRTNIGYSNNHQSSSPYGPYHSYAVKPAVYGGPGMYHYRGYTRSPQYRVTRSSYGNAQKSHYGLKPVKAVMIIPSGYSSRYSYRQNQSGYNSASAHNSAAAYRPAQYSGRSYARAPAHSSRYNTGNGYRQSHYPRPAHYGGAYSRPSGEHLATAYIG